MTWTLTSKRNRRTQQPSTCLLPHRLMTWSRVHSDRQQSDRSELLQQNYVKLVSTVTFMLNLRYTSFKKPHQLRTYSILHYWHATPNSPAPPMQHSAARAEIQRTDRPASPAGRTLTTLNEFDWPLQTHRQTESPYYITDEWKSSNFHFLRHVTSVYSLISSLSNRTFAHRQLCRL